MYTLQAMLCSIKFGVFFTILGYETLFRTSWWHMTSRELDLAKLVMLKTSLFWFEHICSKAFRTMFILQFSRWGFPRSENVYNLHHCLKHSRAFTRVGNIQPYMYDVHGLSLRLQRCLTNIIYYDRAYLYNHMQLNSCLYNKITNGVTSEV